MSAVSGRTLVFIAAIETLISSGALARQGAEAPTPEVKLTSSTPHLDPAEVKKLKNPVPPGQEATAKGKRLYDQFCIQCHGEDGKAQFQVVANATDLTDPPLYKSGTTEGEIFRSIRDGAGLAMPAYRGQIKTETEIWQLVHYIRSLWP